MKLFPAHILILEEIARLAKSNRLFDMDAVAKKLSITVRVARNYTNQLHHSGHLERVEVGIHGIAIRHVGTGLQTAPVNQRTVNKAVVDEVIFTVLNVAAEQESVVPSTAELGKIIGDLSESPVQSSIGRLVRAGRIETIGPKSTVQYRIVKTGKVTAKRDVSKTHIPQRQSSILKNAFELPRIQQDACGYCGLPATVGMHSRCGSSRAVDYVALPRDWKPAFEPYRVGP